MTCWVHETMHYVEQNNPIKLSSQNLSGKVMIASSNVFSIEYLKSV